MSNTVLPFTPLRPYSEWREPLTTTARLNSGLTATRAEHGTYGITRVKARFRFPYGGYTIADWHDFVEDRQGAYDTFLFKLLGAQFRTSTAEAVGTGNGSATAFALDFKHVDSSTLLVYKAGVLQTLTTHYTFGGNNTAPTVTFVSAPGGGEAITATYDYYHPMRFAADEMQPRDLNPVTTAASALWEIETEMVEDYPGAHRA